MAKLTADFLLERLAGERCAAHLRLPGRARRDPAVFRQKLLEYLPGRG